MRGPREWWRRGWGRGRSREQGAIVGAGGERGEEGAITLSCKGVKHAHLLPCDLQCYVLGTPCLAPQGVAVSPVWARGMV